MQYAVLFFNCKVAGSKLCNLAHYQHIPYKVHHTGKKIKSYFRCDISLIRISSKSSFRPCRNSGFYLKAGMPVI
jgi:hypothetical protein